MSANQAGYHAYRQRQDHTPMSSAHSVGRPSDITAEVQNKASKPAERSSAVPVPTLSYVAYFTHAQLEQMYARQRGSKMSAAKWQSNCTLATGFVQATASRLGFPQRTIATAQQLYQRFHLFYPPSEFVLHELAVTCLFVAAKLNDTPKKAREILLASYALRFPQLVKGASSEAEQAPSGSATGAQNGVNDEIVFPTLAGQKRKAIPSASTSTSHSQPSPAQTGHLLWTNPIAIGSVSEGDIDPSILETDRKRLMALEKLVLKTLCFNFHLKSSVALKMMIKLGRAHHLPKTFLGMAWKIAADMHRTTAPLQYPPNVIAMASLYAAALLVCSPNRGAGPPSQQEKQIDPISSFVESFRSISPPKDGSRDSLGRIETSCHVHIEDVEEAIHELLDLYLTCCSQLPPSVYMQNPGGTATPSPHSPADPLDVLTASPSSSTGLSDSSMQQGSVGRRKLKQYEYAPPPFGVLDWLNTRRSLQLTGDATTPRTQARPSETCAAPSKTPASSVTAVSNTTNSDPTAPAKQLSALLTDLKIYLRGIEYDRQKADDSLLTSLGIFAQIQTTPTVPTSSPLQNTADTPAVTNIQVLLSQIGDRQNGASAHWQTSKPYELSRLKADDRVIVERIQRRKLATSLRSVFVEPNVALHPDVVGPRPLQQADMSAGEANQTATGASTPTQKRQRIEHATRYIF